MRFTDEHFRFKSAIYIYRANHSRFNTAWGSLEAGPPVGWLINDRPIMAMEEQRQVAKVFIAAFLEGTLNGKDEYLPVFKDVRHAGHWLPEDIYVNRYQDTLIELTIELSDNNGNCAALPLSTVGPVHPALTVRLAKWKWLEKKYIDEFSERLLQTYEIPFRQFVEANSSFDPSRLENIRFVFDRFPNGTIMLDDIGISM